MANTVSQSMATYTNQLSLAYTDVSMCGSKVQEASLDSIINSTVFCMSFLHVALLLSLKWSLLVTTLKTEVLEVKAGSTCKYHANIWAGLIKPHRVMMSTALGCVRTCVPVGEACLETSAVWGPMGG